MDLTLEVNGVKHGVAVEPETSLLEVLRDDIGLTGAKYGCGEGQCGACTVLLGGEGVHSCVTAVGDAVGKPVVTIEGLAKDGKLDPLQKAFLEEGAMQCGYCVPGMILAARAMLNKTPHPTTAEIVKHMDGNICRCGGYPRMLEAIESVARSK